MLGTFALHLLSVYLHPCWFSKVTLYQVYAISKMFLYFSAFFLFYIYHEAEQNYRNEL